MWSKKLKDPFIFQGAIKESQYFEGWYFKQVSKDEKRVISIIPGISLVKGDSHSFVQYVLVCMDENNNKLMKTGYVRYPLRDFKVENEPFTLQVSDNYFSRSMISVRILDGNTIITGTLHFGDFTPIQRTVFMPNIMGIFAYLPKMECYHGICSMTHSVNGVLKIQEDEMDFNDGKGYIEKDWGTSFPQKYVWIQCNNFIKKSTSLFCSIAKIPISTKSFIGFIANLVLEGKEYRFATYNHSKLKIESIHDGKIMIILEHKKAKLIIEGKVNETGKLIAPRNGKMQDIIKEELSGEVSIHLYDKQRDKTYEEYGLVAGIEIVGF